LTHADPVVMAPKRSADPSAMASKRCKIVADAVKASSSFPASVIQMLGAAAPGALGDLPGDRDAYQRAFVEMVGAALVGEEASLKGKAAEAEAEANKASQAAADAEAETKRIDDAIAAKAEDITAKTAKAEEAEASAKACQGNLKAAQKAKADFDGDAATVKDERDEVAKIISDDFNLVRDSPPAHKGAVRKHINSITKSLAHHEAEEALVIATPSSLGKGPDSRGTFDKLLIDHLGKLLSETLEKFNGKIAANEQQAANLAAAVDAAQQALDAAKTQETASEEAQKGAEAEHKSLKAELKDAKHKAKDVASEAKGAAKGKAEADAELVDFAEVLGAFALQRDGPPEEPVPEEPAPAEP